MARHGWFMSILASFVARSASAHGHGPYGGHGPPMGGHGFGHAGFHGGHGYDPFTAGHGGHGGMWAGPPHHHPMLWFSIIFAVGVFLYFKFVVGFKGSELAKKRNQ